MFSAEKASPIWSKAYLALLILPLTNGCSVYSKPVIQQSFGNVANMREVVLLKDDTDTNIRSSFHERLKTAFGARGIAAQDTVRPTSEEEQIGQQFLGKFALSTMPADMSLASSKPQIGSKTARPEFKVRSRARGTYVFDGCEVVRYRASLVLFDTQSGKRVHRAEGESHGCVNDPAPLDDLADLLVGDALSAHN